MELNESQATNDAIRGAASITFGGTFRLTNLTEVLVAGAAGLSGHQVF